MWSKLIRGLKGTSPSESASQPATDLPPDLAALGQELSRQAGHLASLYPAGPAPRWLAAQPAHARKRLPKAGATPQALAKIWRRLHGRWAAALGVSLLAAALVSVWAVSSLLHSAGEGFSSGSRAVAHGGTRPSQPNADQAAAYPAGDSGALPAAHASKRLMPDTRPEHAPLATRGNEAVAGNDARSSSVRSSARPEMPAKLFETLGRPEQEAVLDLLNDLSPPEGTLDL